MVHIPRDVIFQEDVGDFFGGNVLVNFIFKDMK
jgi:hypothetical protein